MKLIYNSVFEQHDTGSHPENAGRLQALGPLEESDVPSGESYLELIHTREYIEWVKQSCKRGEPLNPDTYVSANSFHAAVHAVGATIRASESGDFALVRPPGHHAYPDHASGFCLFNNIAIATQKLVNEGKRLLIFDFDGHLGDGTETVFYDTDQVLYWSLHQYPAFPGMGTAHEIGTGKGEGFTINVALPPRTGDVVYMRAVHALMPIAEQFNPDVVAVSAGFDAHHSDPLLDLQLSTNTYYKLGVLLGKRFDHVFAALEGGYNTSYLPLCIHEFVRGINGEPSQSEEQSTETPITVFTEFQVRLQELERILAAFWEL